MLARLQVRGGGPEKDDGQLLALCKFDTLDADAFHQSDMRTHDDSDDSDGYSIDSDRCATVAFLMPRLCSKGLPLAEASLARSCRVHHATLVCAFVTIPWHAVTTRRSTSRSASGG